jgi:hypothetical protein
MNKAVRISQKRLTQIIRRIAVRDKNVMLSLQNCRYLTTLQIMRLHFRDAATTDAALRAANRALTKLKEYGLIFALVRRIGGVRAGSGSYVWSLTTAGVKLLRADGAEVLPRKRCFEPTPYFLAHTLAAAETYVRLSLMHGTDGLEITELQTEPDCWRKYKNGEGKTITLKPDLSVTVIAEDYEYRYFLELDLATEAPVRILVKCRRYLDYYRSGEEQRQNGMFPYAVWIVPTGKRKDSILFHIRETYPNAPRIFRVITPDEFEGRIRNGMEQTSTLSTAISAVKTANTRKETN